MSKHSLVRGCMQWCEQGWKKPYISVYICARKNVKKMDKKEWYRIYSKLKCTVHISKNNDAYLSLHLRFESYWRQRYPGQGKMVQM